MKKIMLSLILLVSGSSFADQWTAERKTLFLNPGAGVAGAGTWIAQADVVYSGCTRTDGAYLQSTHPDYKEIYSLLLAAKMSDKPVKVYYGDCVGNFTMIKQVALY